jgi:hypothetical protein
MGHVCFSHIKANTFCDENLLLAYPHFYARTLGTVSNVDCLFVGQDLRDRELQVRHREGGRVQGLHGELLRQDEFVKKSAKMKPNPFLS